MPWLRNRFGGGYVGWCGCVGGGYVGWRGRIGGLGGNDGVPVAFGGGSCERLGGGTTCAAPWLRMGGTVRGAAGSNGGVFRKGCVAGVDGGVFFQTFARRTISLLLKCPHQNCNFSTAVSMS